MKSERKQIQESNLLADKIEAQIVKFKKTIPAVLALAVVAILGMLAYGFYSTMQEANAAKGWTEFYFANTEPKDLTAIANSHDGTPASLWAKQTLADAYMARALEKVYLDRELADQYYKQAQDEYQSVAGKTSDPFLKARALYGLAQAYEGLSDREQASATYRKVTLITGLAPEFLAEATKRSQWLESKQAEEFYAWYKANRPTAPVLQDLPNARGPLPSSPDIQFKDLPGAANLQNGIIPESGATGDLPTVPTPAVTPSNPADSPSEPAPSKPE